jgi:hypothetical protein
MPLELKPGAPDVAADQPFGVAAAQRVDEKLMLVMDAVPALGEEDSRRRLAALAGAVPWPQGDVAECTRGRGRVAREVELTVEREKLFDTRTALHRVREGLEVAPL